MNTGEIIPILVDEVLPGDTIKINVGTLLRGSTPIHPVMDQAYLDIYFFAVPNRLVWEHWKNFMGENTTSAWEEETEYEIPQITAPSGGWQKGTIMDHMGIPTGVSGISVSALFPRAYTLTINDWFRDQNLQDPAALSLGDSATTGNNGTDYVTDLQCGGMPFKAAKYHDYFTSALPEPQKGPDVLLPLGDTAPVIGNGNAIGINYFSNPEGSKVYLGGQHSNTVNNTLGLYSVNGQDVKKGANSDAEKINMGSNEGTKYMLGLDERKEYSGVITDLSQATASTVNQLRMSFALQRMLEKDARGGTRYIEIIKAHFGITSPDARQQRPEYLGGKRIPINNYQVLQTSSTDTTTPQGNTAAFSYTTDQEIAFTKSFTEHEIILGLAVVRTLHSYQQGINKMFSRTKREDFYFPSLANIGEQAILNKEIYAQGNASDNEAFGYQEAWAEYRYKPNQITGALRSTYAQSLDSWHYGDNYSSLPILGPTWIQETTANVDRTLAVQSTVEDQWIADFYFSYKCTRPMPVTSIPGLIDHH